MASKVVPGRALGGPPGGDNRSPTPAYPTDTWPQGQGHPDQARIRLLQDQNQTPVEFKNLLQTSENDEENKTFSCKIVGLPLVKSSIFIPPKESIIFFST